MAINAPYLGIPAPGQRSRRRESRLFPALRRAPLPSAVLRRLRPGALSADHRLPVVRRAGRALGPGRGTRRRAFLHRGASRDSAAFKPYVPYLVLLVELDTQRGRPTEHEALRVFGNLTTPDGVLAPPDLVRSVGIGSRVRMVFSDVAEGLALPQWTLDETVPQPAVPWRYPQE
ncbi:MAG: hypothetical protein WDO24_20520 [Pseudomonadota bacterium]